MGHCGPPDLTPGKGGGHSQKDFHNKVYKDFNKNDALFEGLEFSRFFWVALGGSGWLGKGGDTARKISTTKFIRILTKKMYFLRGWNF